MREWFEGNSLEKLHDRIDQFVRYHSNCDWKLLMNGDWFTMKVMKLSFIHWFPRMNWVWEKHADIAMMLDRMLTRRKMPSDADLEKKRACKVMKRYFEPGGICLRLAACLHSVYERSISATCFRELVHTRKSLNERRFCDDTPHNERAFGVNQLQSRTRGG